MHNKPHSIYKEFKLLILAFCCGGLFVIYLMPYLIFHPTDIYALKNDAMQHYIGWEFYRSSPWQWPLTFNHRLMYPFGISLIFTDSFPLVSVLLKLFSDILPEHFLWQGYVAIINLSLMFYFGMKLIRTRINNDYYCILGGLIFMLSSPLLFRCIEHLSLTTQWLIVFELYLILKPHSHLRNDILNQSLILFIVAGTHPYLAGMLLPMSICLCWNLSVRKSCSRLIAVGLLGLFCVQMLFFAWIFGWFDIHSSGSDFGYGYYSFNLLSFIDPLYGALVFKELPAGQWQYEGFAYLGIGIITMLLITLYQLKLTDFNSEKIVLLIILFLLCGFAISNTIQVGSYSTTIDLPQVIADKVGIFRASGRFAWPLFYALTFFAYVGAYRALSYSPYRRAILFALLVVLQCADNYSLIQKVKNSWRDNVINKSSLYLTFKSNVWRQLGNKYQVEHIFIMDNFDGSERGKFALLALKNNTTLNLMYLSRNSSVYQLQYHMAVESFINGNLESSTLYIGNKDSFKHYPIKHCSTLDNYIICSNNETILDQGERLIK